MNKQAKLAAVAVALVLGGSAAAVYGYRQYLADTGSAPFHGSVDVRSVALGFRVAGRVSEVLVDEGAAVKAGQLIARLDPEPYLRQRDEAQAARDAAQARLSLLERGHDPEQLARAAAQLDERRATWLNAQKQEARTTELRGIGAAAQRTLDDARAAREEAAARVRVAEQELARFKRGYRSEEIAEARANAARAEAALARTRLQLDDTELRAPEPGLVQTRAIEPGAFVNAGAAGLVLSKTGETWVRAYIEEPRLGAVVPGARVLIETDSRPGQPYAGRIGSVSPRAEFTPRNVETTELRTSLVYRVRVLVDQPDDALRQGMPVSVRLQGKEQSS